MLGGGSGGGTNSGSKKIENTGDKTRHSNHHSLLRGRYQSRPRK